MEPMRNYTPNILDSTNSDKDGFEYKDDDTQVNNTSPPDTSVHAHSIINQPVGLSKNVSAFLVKLYNMVGDPSTDWLIGWSAGGLSFMVYDHQEFARQVLPMFFKHSNFASFVRQLNMYGFHKLPVVHQGMAFPRLQSEIWEFTHPRFRKNMPELLCYVQRKKSRDQPEAVTPSPGMGYILDKIEALRNHQILISNEIKNLQVDYKDLYSRFMEMNSRYQVQQEKIDKIIKFIASLYSYRCDQVGSSKRKRLIEQQDNTASFNTSYSSPSESKHGTDKVRVGLSHQEEQKIQNLLPYVPNANTFHKNVTQDKDLIRTPLQQTLVGSSNPYNIPQTNPQALSLQSNISNVPTGPIDRFTDYRLPPETSALPILRMLTNPKIIPQVQDDYLLHNFSGQGNLQNRVHGQFPALENYARHSSTNEDAVKDDISSSITKSQISSSVATPNQCPSVSLVKLWPDETLYKYQNPIFDLQNQIISPALHTESHVNKPAPITLPESKRSPELQQTNSTVHQLSQLSSSEPQPTTYNQQPLPCLSSFPPGLNSIESKLENLCTRSSAIKNAERSLNSDVEALSSMVGSECLDGLEDIDDFDNLYNFIGFDSLLELDDQNRLDSSNQTQSNPEPPSKQLK